MNVKLSPFPLTKPVCLLSSGSVVGQKEKKGPLGDRFDLSGDDRFGKDTWEKSEAEMQRLALGIALKKACLCDDSMDLLFAGDLINQCISSAFGLANYRIPLLGLFGACSTCAEGLLLGAIAAATVCDRCAAVTSSHYCSAERQFRYPLEYGGQRPPTAQWTVTGAGAFLLSSLPQDMAQSHGSFLPVITDVMPGCLVDRGIKDAGNMGAAMAPAAADTLERYFAGTNRSPTSYDGIFTGDLGREGSEILLDLLRFRGIDIAACHSDCGNRIYSAEDDVHAGGSGCGCSAVVLAAELLPLIRDGVLRDVLFVGTGALMNTMTVNQKQSIPAVAHLVHIRGIRKSELLSKEETETEVSHGHAD